MQATLNAMLARTLGPSKAQVQVHADLNVDQTTQEKLTYAKKGTPLQTTKRDREPEGRAAAPPAAPPAPAANLPTYAQSAARRRGNSNYKRTTGTTDFGVDKTVTTRRSRPAPSTSSTSRCWSTSRSRPPRSPQLKKAVAAAAGIDPTRGDTMTQRSQVAFAKPGRRRPGRPPVPPALLGPLKYVGPRPRRACSSSSS